MDPERLRKLLTVLREAGVKSAKVPLVDARSLDIGTEALSLDVEFAEQPEPPAKGLAIPEDAVLIDKRTGQPVDLDEGAPDLARDPGDAIRGANFPPKT